MSTTTEAGQAAYTTGLLSIYDLYVLGFTNRLIWRCPSSILLEQYNQLVGSRHLDVGVGTGYFLDKREPRGQTEITLFDLNPNSLAHCSHRIRRYNPRTVVGDVLRPIDLPSQSFDSIGINFLIHCLPSDVEGGKWKLFANLKPLLANDGTLFGSTVLGSGTPKNFFQRKLMDFYNKKGIFGNQADSIQAIEESLRLHFGRVDIEQNGVVALFKARDPR